MKNVAPDHSSRETLADYGDHRFRLLYRDANGLPEEHDKSRMLQMISHNAMDKLRGDAMKRAEDAETAAEEMLADAGLAESGTVAASADMPKEIILQNAEEWGADLIVCGSHGRRGLSRFMLGSVSEAIAAHAKCSVEIIRQISA